MWIFGAKELAKSGFSARSTAEEVTEGIDGTGLTAIVTGATSGIGTETARVLALRGVHVIMAVRNTESGRKIKDEILKDIPAAKIDVMELDLSSLASVKFFASSYISSALPLNILIVLKLISYGVGSNNAGVMAIPFMLSRDNIELHFATNHLGHFMLTNLLLDTMKNTVCESKKEGRVINVSSLAHRFAYSGGIRFDNINDESGYGRMSAYGQSKLANILHTNELARRMKDEGVEITANSLHPGAIASTVARYDGYLKGVVHNLAHYFLKTIPQGAATTCYLALNPQVKGVSGEYFSDVNIAKRSSLATDAELAKKLWDLSLSMTESPSNLVASQGLL